MEGSEGCEIRDDNQQAAVFLQDDRSTGKCLHTPFCSPTHCRS